MKKLFTLLTCALLATGGGIASAAVIFDQDDTATSDWTSSDSGNDISDPPSGVTASVGSEWVSTNAGIGILDNASNIVQWTFDFTIDELAGQTQSIILAGASGTFHASGPTFNDVYLFGMDYDNNDLNLAKSTAGGKNGAGDEDGSLTGPTILWDTTVDLSSTGSGSATITFDPTSKEWTVVGNYGGASFDSGSTTITDSEFTGQAMDFLGAYTRGDGPNPDGSITLADMRVRVIPEPSAGALLMAVLGLGLLMRRRR
jgi:hypothetical protein